MLAAAGQVAGDCTRTGIPLLVMIYPRGNGIDPVSPAAVGHCVRVAEELGADMIKTNYTGDPASFARIVRSCSVPVFIAGGERSGDIGSLTTIRDAVRVGGAGVCVGRNAFQRDDPAVFVRALCRVVHGDEDPAGALRERPADPAGKAQSGGHDPHRRATARRAHRACRPAAIRA